MTEKNISQKFRLKKIDKTRNFFVKDTEQNELMSKKQKKVFKTLNYILQLYSTVTRCISISAFSFLFGIPIRITSSVIGLKVCEIIAGIKKYKSIIRKKKKHDKRVLLAKA